MSSSGFSSNSSSSTPVVVSTPENAILDQIAQYASSLAPQMLSWAQGAYAKSSGVTDAAVQNFLGASQQMTGLAGTMTNEYNTLEAPELQQLYADANSYASPARMSTDMGMAGAKQAQAGDQAIKNSEQNLLSYGIDPSAGRYAALDKAAAVQNSANVAGAENTQRMADINTGQQLRAEAIQAGSLLPSAISNAENTAIQANAGAANASQANANTGANLMNVANNYLQTAMNLKLSPTGQQSQSSGFSSNSSSSGGGGGGSSGGGGGGGSYGGGGGGGGGSSYAPDQQDMTGDTYAQGLDPSGGGYQPSAGIQSVPDYGYGNSGDSSSSDFGGGDSSLLTDTGGGGGDWGASFALGGPVGGYDDGGAIPSAGATTGGFVSPQMSPSGGAQTDDVNAHLNADEFVIPRDVSNWKGQEFFHKLIADSRNKRSQMQAMSPVGPKPAQQRPGPAVFQSRRVA